MAFILKKKDVMDTISTRWIEPAPGLRLLIGSTARPGYNSDYRQIQRHLDAAARHLGVGTGDFDILKKTDYDIPDPDMLFIDLACKHLILDWEGVAEAEDPDTQAPYTPERGRLLIEQMPEIYLLALNTGNAIALRQQEQIAESVEKPLPPTVGPRSGRARKTKESGKSAKG